MDFPADYFDGRSSQRYPVRVSVEGDRVVIRGEGVELEHATSELQVQPRLGSTPWRIALPGGGVLITQSPIETILPVPPSTGFAHRLESNLWMVVASLVGLVVAGWFGYRDGIPWAARHVAARVPHDIEANIAVEGMKELDRFVFEPTKLPPDRASRLREVFAQLAAGRAAPARIEFRDGTFLGANAFALPGGVVVITDQLVVMLEDDDRIAAVLAHEIGHLEHRHGLRHILQDSISALAAAAVLGDLSSLGGLAATLPTVVTHTTYSRGFEREADTFAYGVLRTSGRSPRLLGEALAALEAQRKRGDEACDVPLEKQEGDAKEKPERKPSQDFSLGYLSTHPSTAERVRAAEEAAK